MRKRFIVKGPELLKSSRLQPVTSSVVPLRCDGGRLQRDQGGGQVHQKRRHGAGVHRRGLGHDVRIPADVPASLQATCHSEEVLRQTDLHCLFPLCLCLLKATEAQQPGAVVRGDRGGAGQPLHRHRVHGQGQCTVSEHTWPHIM